MALEDRDVVELGEGELEVVAVPDAEMEAVAELLAVALAVGD